MSEFCNASYNPGYSDDNSGSPTHVNTCYDWVNSSECDGSYHVDNSKCGNKHSHAHTFPHSQTFPFSESYPHSQSFPHSETYPHSEDYPHQETYPHDNTPHINFCNYSFTNAGC